MPDDSAKYGQSQDVPPSELLQQVLAYRLTLASIANNACCERCREAALVARNAIYPDAAAPEPKIKLADFAAHPFTAATLWKETAPNSPFLSLEMTADNSVMVAVDEGYAQSGASITVPYDAFEELFNRFIVATLVAREDEPGSRASAQLLRPTEVQE
jgi:hypothetical protein